MILSQILRGGAEKIIIHFNIQATSEQKIYEYIQLQENIWTIAAFKYEDG
jgi:hypothetical protein